MNRKQIIILLGVLGLLIVAVIVKRAAPRPEVYKEETQPLEIAFSPDTVTRLVLSKGPGEGERVELQRTNSAWRIPSLWNAKADAEKVERFLDSVSALKGEVRSAADDVLSDFGITDEQAFHVTAFQDARPVLHLLLGTAQAGWQQLFVRQANSSTVFLAQSNLLSEMGIYGQASDTTKPSADVWADLRLLAFSPEFITRVELKEQGADWQELGGQLPFERDPAKVQTYLQELLNLRAQRVVDPAGTAYGLTEPAWQLRFVKREGAPLVLTVGAPTAEGSTDRYLRVEAAPDVYVASSYILDRIKVDGSRFLAEDPLSVGEARYDTLTVTTPGKEATVAIQKDHWPGVDQYLQALKTFRVARAQGLPDRTKTELKTPYQLTVSGGAESLTVACEAPVTAETDEIVCINRQNAVPFLIARPTFQAVFERLERLEQPAPAPQEPPAAAASGPSEQSHDASPAGGDHKDETKP